jgi:F-type H+-transporting ATPase subunit alpha
VREYALPDIQRYEGEMLTWMRASHPDLLEAIRSSGKLEEEAERKLVAALDAFRAMFQPSGQSEAA